MQYIAYLDIQSPPFADAGIYTGDVRAGEEEPFNDESFADTNRNDCSCASCFLSKLT